MLVVSRNQTKMIDILHILYSLCLLTTETKTMLRMVSAVRSYQEEINVVMVPWNSNLKLQAQNVNNLRVSGTRRRLHQVSGVAIGVAFCCCSPSASTLSCVVHSETFCMHQLQKSVYSVTFLSSQLSQFHVLPLIWKRQCCPHNCCSLDTFSFPALFSLNACDGCTCKSRHIGSFSNAQTKHLTPINTTSETEIVFFFPILVRGLTFKSPSPCIYI